MLGDFAPGGLYRILELSDTVKHLRGRNNEKDASLAAAHVSLDTMVGPWDSVVGGGQINGW